MQATPEDAGLLIVYQSGHCLKKCTFLLSNKCVSSLSLSPQKKRSYMYGYNTFKLATQIFFFSFLNNKTYTCFKFTTKHAEAPK